MEYEHILRPLDIRNLHLKNRIVFSAIPTKMVKDGYIEDNLIDYHIERVRGGAALNILEPTTVHIASAPENHLSIGEDKFIDSLKKLTDQIHQHKGKIGIQLIQGGIYETENIHREYIVPSKHCLKNGREIEPASLETIDEVVKSFGSAAGRAEKAGFDCIEINIGRNDICHLFLSKEFNRRRDKYGGSLENRLRITEEILVEIKKNVSEDLPIFLKIISNDDNYKEGLSLEDIINSINLLEKYIDVVIVSRGNIDTNAIKYIAPSMDIEENFNMPNIKEIKKASNVLVGATGRINSPESMEEILRGQEADLIFLGRPLLADPHLVKKLEENRRADIIKCLSCNQGCFDSLENILYPNISCLRNPSIGKEKDFKIKKTKEEQKIAVVGGGIAGLIVAELLFKRGHRPVLYEKTHRLGGQMIYAGTSQRKKDINKVVREKIRLIEESPIEIHMNTEFKDRMVTEGKFDSVVIASGSSPKILKIEGREASYVMDYMEAFENQEKLKGRVGIIGSGLIALELGELLKNKGCKVILVEEKDEIGEDLGKIRKITLLNEIRDLDIEIKSGLEIVSIKDNMLYYIKNKKEKSIKADFFIMAYGAESNKSNSIKQYCQDREIPFYVIGDALIPRMALDAVSEATNIALVEIP